MKHSEYSLPGQRWGWPAATVLAAATALGLHAAPIITNVTETGGDNEATDTVPAKWTGVSFVSGVADEPVPGTAADAAYAVGFFANQSPAFVDRNHRYQNDDGNSLPIPEYLLDAEYIMSGNDNRDNDPYQLDVTVAKEVICYMLIDNRTGGGDNATPPTIGPGSGVMEWIDPADGWAPVISAGNRRGDASQPDEVAIDEGADGTINQWYSVYSKIFAAGTFSLYQANNAGQNMYGVVIREAPTAPQMGSVSASPASFRTYLQDLGGFAINPASIVATLDGETVTTTNVKNGPRTDISYNLFAAKNEFFASGSDHSLTVSANDTAGGSYTFEKTFTVGAYGTVPGAWKLGAATGPGMNVAVYQTDEVPAPNQNTVATSEQWWARGLTTGNTPWVNVAFDTDPIITGGLTVVNWVGDFSLWGGEIDDTPANGPDNFNSARPAASPVFNDYCPGIPGLGLTPYDNYAIEVVTYLQLNRGFYRMGVNSDDGFVVRVAPGQPGVRGMILGQYDGGRGAADSLFDVVIEENGYYPFRLLYWQGTGGASCEWFSVNPDTGDKTLINGTGTSIKAYKTASDRAVVTKLLPADGFQGAEPAAGVRLTIEDGTTQLKTGSVRLMIDDVAVTPSVTKSGTTTTISWAPPLQYEFLSDHTGRLVWTETTNPETEWTEDFTFRVRDVDGTKDPAVLLSLPADEMLADGVVLVWSIGKYATQLNPASLQIQVDGNNVTAQAAVTEDATRHYVTVDLSGTTFNAGDHSWSFRWADTGSKTETVTGAFRVSGRQRLILNVVETGGDNEPTDTIVAQWTGETFVNGVANEPLLNTADDAPYLVGLFANEAPAYVDRAHRYLNDDASSLPIPGYLIGGEYIMSGNDNRDNDTYVLDVTVSQEVTVFMLIDNRTNKADGSNTAPPTIGPGTGAMEWIDETWEPVVFAGNRRGDDTQPDELGFDEGADNTINQWCSVYRKNFPAGTFQLYHANNAGRNMYGVVVTEPWTPSTSLILDVVETGGDNEATDTIVAQWTGQTFVNGVADEPLLGTAADAPYTVGLFANQAPAFVDRAHRYLDDAANGLPIPAYLVGGEYLMSGNDNRDNDAYVLDVTVSRTVDVYLLIDNRTNDGVASDPPAIGPGTGAMEWVDPAQGWEPVISAGNRRHDNLQPDEIGFDEGADDTINQWYSVYRRQVPAGAFQLRQANNAGRNMYGAVVTVPQDLPPRLNAALEGGSVVLTWPGGGPLEAATSVQGPYIVISAATSPYTVPPSGGAMFYRLGE